SSLVQQPDGELIRAIVDQGSLSDADSGIQFDLGALSRKVGQEEVFIQEPADLDAPALKSGADTSSKVRGLTITTTRKHITGSSTTTQVNSLSSQPAHQPEGRKQLISSQPAQRKQRVRKDLPTVSSVSPDAIPGLRRQASVVDPEQAKQQEKGWGLAFKDPSKAAPVRKEVEVSSPREDDLERVRQLTLEKEALAQQRAQTERAKQEADAEQQEAAKQAKAAARRVAVEAAAAQRAEEVRKRQEFMQETNKMYKMTKQQEEQHTPTFVRMQQQAAAKEAEEAAEKKRIWEEEVASKKFWFTDIQASLEGANHSGPSIGTLEGQTSSGSPSEPKESGPLSPALSPETSAGQLQGEISQGSLGTVLGDEQKRKARREWQQSLRNSGKFKNSDAQKTPWGLSAHGPKLERRLRYHQMQDRGCSPMSPSGMADNEQDGLLASGSMANKAFDPLNNTNSLSDLTRSLYSLPPSLPQSSIPTQVPTADSIQHGPLVQTMHSIVNRSGSSSAQAAGKAQEGAQKGSNGSDCAVNSTSSSASAGLGGGASCQADVGSDGASVADIAGPDSQAADAVKQQAPVDDYYRLWFTWSDALKADAAKQQAPVDDYYRLWFTWSDALKAESTSPGMAEKMVPESTAGGQPARLKSITGWIHGRNKTVASSRILEGIPT
ncbi:MAG: hypothetical protein FRX49_12178, partial [Trebouxia sp. A1-2]